jgi:hypothetical protein
VDSIRNQILEQVFPEERNWLVGRLRDQKRNLRFWLLVAVILALIPLFVWLTQVLNFVGHNTQLVFNWIIFCWLIAVIVVPNIWPQKPGDVFRENFTAGINPRLWEWHGQWTVELDENGKSVLSVTNSELGGLVLPCLSWADYDLRFETRILNKVTGWLIRASNLNNCVMFQLSPTTIKPHIKSVGVWIPQADIVHNAPISVGEWFSVQTLARGSWATVYLTVKGKQQKIFEDKILGTQPIFWGNIPRDTVDAPEGKQLVALEVSYRPGSFGFRQSVDEKAQFRNLKVFKLR